MNAMFLGVVDLAIIFLRSKFSSVEDDFSEFILNGTLFYYHNF